MSLDPITTVSVYMVFFPTYREDAQSCRKKEVRHTGLSIVALRGTRGCQVALMQFLAGKGD